jgi:hypothetical protein
MNPKLIMILSALMLVLAACGDDDKSPVRAEPSSDAGSPSLGVTPAADGGASVAPVGPGSSATAAGTAPIPLLVWVDDLVDHHSTDDAIPDTVDDKNIVDDENASAYNARF